jgi:pimeloyl-ACP methyl ester carboxylesterase
MTLTYDQPGMRVTEHTFEVPLDHRRPDGGTISVFAREISARSGAGQRPWLLFLQGGPGGAGPRPAKAEGWLARALAEYRVLLLDQRGTGRSSPATRQTLASAVPARQAAHLAMLRADSIVADAEIIRQRLTGGEPWSVLGQSFGGFCAVTYLSAAPEGLREVFITGGLPGLDVTADDVYRLTYPIVAARNRAHYERYPGDAAMAVRVARHLAGHEVLLPGGGRLTVEAFQSLGRMFGTSTGSQELHYLLEDPFAGGELSDAFRHAAGAYLSFAPMPLYAALQEPCYAQGPATRWAAQRVRAEFSGFSPAAALDGDGPLLFTGEMIYPWMFRTDPALLPLAEAADLLAERDGWPRLYDPARLAANQVPAAAAVYFHDMYVPAELSLRTAAVIPRLQAWVTSEYEHDALRGSGGAVLDKLIAMARDGT